MRLRLFVEFHNLDENVNENLLPSSTFANHDQQLEFQHDVIIAVQENIVLISVETMCFFIFGFQLMQMFGKPVHATHMVQLLIYSPFHSNNLESDQESYIFSRNKIRRIMEKMNVDEIEFDLVQFPPRPHEAFSGPPILKRIGNPCPVTVTNNDIYSRA